MEIKKSAGIRGKKNQERIDPKMITEEFVVDFPLSPFQKKVIELVYFMRAVKTSQIVDITGYHYRYVSDQLLQLYLNRFIDRDFPLRERDQKGTNEAYYLLDTAGAIYISGAYELPMKDIKWRIRDNLIKVDKLEHTFVIADVRAAMEKEARERGHSIVKCLGDRHLDIQFTFEQQKYEFRPDMYMKYRDKKYEYDFLFEVDLGTMNVTGINPKTVAFDKKVPVYEKYRASGVYKETFDRFPKVIVITTTIERAKKLKDAVKEKQQTEKVEFLFTSIAIWQEACMAGILVDVEGNMRTLFN